MAKKEKAFDIFLSYKSEDSKWVQGLKSSLEQRGIKVWMDKNEIRPGDLFAKALEDGIENSSSVGLVVTPESMRSDWVKEEYYRALSLATAKQLQLIPLLLRDTELPGFLAGRQYVDFRSERDFDLAVDQLIWPGITGKRIFAFLAEFHYATNWRREPFYELGIDPGGWSGFGRVQEVVMMMEYGKYHDHPLLHFGEKIAVFVDLFGDDQEFERAQHIIDQMFNIRKQTRGTDFEPLFVLYHRSDAFEKAKFHLDSEVINRLSHYHTLFSDLDDQELRSALRKVWNAVQKDFLMADRKQLLVTK